MNLSVWTDNLKSIRFASIISTRPPAIAKLSFDSEIDLCENGELTTIICTSVVTMNKKSAHFT